MLHFEPVEGKSNTLEFFICVVPGWRLARAWWELTMLVLIAEVEVFPVMEKMNKPVPHQLSFLRLVSTVCVAAILIHELLP